jgi:hypothetical protein
MLNSRGMVGLGRFELPTSRLSGVRSNQLSYRPAHLSCRSADDLLTLPQRFVVRERHKDDSLKTEQERQEDETLPEHYYSDRFLSTSGCYSTTPCDVDHDLVLIRGERAP